MKNKRVKPNGLVLTPLALRLKVRPKICFPDPLMTTLFGWFDIVAVILIATGVLVGRRRGMSTELLSLITWLAIVIVSAQLNPFLGRRLTQISGLGAGFGFMGAYLGVAALIWALGALIRYRLGDKLVGSDVFGGYEYYLGMVAGGIRFLCILFFLLALIGAPQYTDSEIQVKIKAQKESLGSIYFPPFGQIQRDVLRDSITGRQALEHASFLLIKVDPSLGGKAHEGIGRRREREVEEIMGR